MYPVNITYKPRGVMLDCNIIKQNLNKVSDYWVELNYTEDHSKEDGQ